MSAGLDPSTGIIFEQVLMQANKIQVTYTQPDDRANPDVVMVRTVLIEVSRLPDFHAEFIDALREMTEESLRVKRSPPDQIFPRQEESDAS